MRFYVRTAEGELTFESREALRDGYAQGLVEDRDEVRADGETEWVAAGSANELDSVRQTRRTLARTGSWYVGGALIALVGVGALALLVPRLPLPDAVPEYFRPLLLILFAVGAATLGMSLYARFVRRSLRRTSGR